MRDLLPHSRNLLKKMCIRISFKRRGNFLISVLPIQPLS
jgi:hypothetical protein